jgi:Large polyvalent protein associated domain 38
MPYLADGSFSPDAPQPAPPNPSAMGFYGLNPDGTAIPGAISGLGAPVASPSSGSDESGSGQSGGGYADKHGKIHPYESSGRGGGMYPYKMPAGAKQSNATVGGKPMELDDYIRSMVRDPKDPNAPAPKLSSLTPEQVLDYSENYAEKMSPRNAKEDPKVLEGIKSQYRSLTNESLPDMYAKWRAQEKANPTPSGTADPGFFSNVGSGLANAAVESHGLGDVGTMLYQLYGPGATDPDKLNAALKDYQDHQTYLANNATPSIHDIMNGKPGASWLGWLGGVIGENIPGLAAGLGAGKVAESATSKISSLLGTKAAQLAAETAQNVATKALASGETDIAANEAAKAAAKDIMSKAVGNTANTAGQATTFATQGALNSAGQTINNSETTTGQAPSGGNVLASLAGGAVAGALPLSVEAKGLQSALRKEGGNFTGNLLTRLGKSGATMAGANVLGTAAGRFGRGEELTSPEAMQQYEEAGAAALPLGIPGGIRQGKGASRTLEYIPKPTGEPNKPGETPPPAAGGPAPTPTGKTTLNPAQQVAYNEAAQSAVTNSEKVPPGASETAVQAAYNDALQTFQGQLAAHDDPAKANVEDPEARRLFSDPAHIAEANAAFSKEWAAKNGVDESVINPQAKPATPAAPVGAPAETPGLNEAEAAQAAAAIPKAGEPAAVTPNEVREAHGPVEPTPPLPEVKAAAETFKSPELDIDTLATQHGIDPTLPTGLTKKIISDLKEAGNAHPSVEDINNGAKKLASILNAQGDINSLIPVRARVEAIGDLLKEKPGTPPTGTQINERAQKILSSKTPVENRIAQRRQEISDAQKERAAVPPKPEAVPEQKPSSPLRIGYEKKLLGHNPVDVIGNAKGVNVLAKRVLTPDKVGGPGLTEQARPKPEAAPKESVAANSRTKDEKGQSITGRSPDDVRLALTKKLGSEETKRLEQAGILRLVQRQSDLPVEAQKPGYTVAGYYDGKTAWLVADHVPEGHEFNTVLHEVGTHYGMRRMLPPELYKTLEDYVESTRTKNTPEGLELAKAYDDAVKANADPRIILNETMATMISNRGAETGTIWNRAWNALKGFLFTKIGKYLPPDVAKKLISNDTIVALAKSATRPFDEPSKVDLGVPAFSRQESKAPTANEVADAWNIKPPEKSIVGKAKDKVSTVFNSSATPSIPITPESQTRQFAQTQFQKYTTKVLNTLKPLMHLNERMAREKKTIGDSTNMYQAFTRLTGARKDITDRQYHAVFEPVENKAVELANRSGVDINKFWNTVVQYIGNKHALEDNKRNELENVKLSPEAEALRAPLKLQVRRGELPADAYLTKLKEIVSAPGARQQASVSPLSGIPNSVAHELVARATKVVPESVLEEMNKAFDPVREQIIKNNVANGKFTSADNNILRSYKSKYYMPNTGFADESLVPKKSQNSFGAFTKEATAQEGRSTLGGNPLDNIIRALRQSGDDIATNSTAKVMYNFASKYGKDLGIKIRTYNMNELTEDALSNGKKLSDVDRVFKDPNTVIYNNGSHRYAITFPEGDPALEAIKASQEPYKAEGLTKVAGKATSTLARLYAGLNPTFAVITSLARDSTAYPTMLIADGKYEAAARYAANYAKFHGPFGAWKTFLGGAKVFSKNFGEIVDYAKAHPDSFADWYTRFSKAGGAFNFKDELSEVGKANDLMTKLQQDSKNPLTSPSKWWNSFKQFQDSMATGSLMIGRTSVFKSLVESGMSEEAAASYAKELTNFQQRSATSDVLNNWFAFSRVGLASADRVAQFFKKADGSFDTAKAARIIAIGAGVSSIYYQMLLSQMGEDKVKKLSNDALSKNFIIPNGTDKPWQIPMGLGLPRLMFGLGMMATRWAHGHITTGEAAESYKNTLMENLSPLHPIQPQEGAKASTQVGDLLTALIPTVGRPVSELALNQSAFGSPIVPSDVEGNPTLKGGYKSESGKLTTPDEWKELAHTVRSLGGPDMYPESLQYLANGYGGGALGMGLRAMKSEQLGKLGEAPSTLETLAPQLENRDIQFAGSRDLSKLRNQLTNASNDVKEDTANNIRIPRETQAQADILRELNSKSAEFNKARATIENNKLSSPESKKSSIDSLTAKWETEQSKLAKQASKYAH